MKQNLKALYTHKDTHLGNVYIVIPKIREVSKGLGAITVTYDNGEKRNLETKNSEETMKTIVDMIEEYYTK
jgi:hypothetical protein